MRSIEQFDCFMGLCMALPQVESFEVLLAIERNALKKIPYEERPLLLQKLVRHYTNLQPSQFARLLENAIGIGDTGAEWVRYLKIDGRTILDHVAEFADEEKLLAIQTLAKILPAASVKMARYLFAEIVDFFEEMSPETAHQALLAILQADEERLGASSVTSPYPAMENLATVLPLQQRGVFNQIFSQRNALHEAMTRQNEKLIQVQLQRERLQRAVQQTGNTAQL
ncbi:MAG: hypothetical protein ACRYGK_11330 [Janthinobacterium lividum]